VAFKAKAGTSGNHLAVTFSKDTGLTTEKQMRKTFAFA